jgi:hypothetical protein
MSTFRKSRKHWCASWGKRRSPPPYSLERLRCGACGHVFTTPAPEGVGEEKYDETAAAMIAQLKYGSGTPFHRLEKLEGLLGIPLPAATQWEIVEEAAEVIRPARDELIRQAAQGEVLHNDDTSMRVLKLEREEGDQRTGVFTGGIVSTHEGQKIALFFTGRQHAGENLADARAAPPNPESLTKMDQRPSEPCETEHMLCPSSNRPDPLVFHSAMHTISEARCRERIRV